MVPLAELERRRKRQSGKGLLPESYQLEVEVDVTQPYKQAWVDSLEQELQKAPTADWTYDPYTFLVDQRHLPNGCRKGHS